uniref:(California timema) hypothetical protein n=1 Tax=Timema californicum TaxID=61474 RepID=A0A7R9P3R1_TIMCA|nr:unnamed protein product [Timema californicum]
MVTLGEILQKLQSEDKVFCAFRRTLGFAQVIKKDLLPLFINVEDVKIVDAVLKILVNLTLPVECLLRTDMLCKTDAGRITVFEVNHLLVTCKEAFVNPRCTGRLVGYMRGFLDKEDKLSPSECESIQNCLLLMRNVLHIPEKLSNGPTCTMQNQILWNLFSHSLDKALIHLMTCQQKAYWAVTMVQVIALMYKDQRVRTLQKMLNQWFESSLSDSSEDEESNTSPSEQISEASSSLLTSDPTSDSSDNGGGPQDIKLVHSPVKINTDYKDSQSEPVVDNQSSHFTMLPLNKELMAAFLRLVEHQTITSQSYCLDMSAAAVVYIKISRGPSKSQPGIGHSRRNSIGKRVRSSEEESGVSSFHSSTESKSCCSSKVNILRGQKRGLSSSELSDYGYGTQVENHEFMSTSSNEDECLQMSVNMKALMHHVPNDEDVSHLMKEFTVDFLLKGYNRLVQELYRQLVETNQALVIDTSHFFWLITYFLKFTTQLELELEHVRSRAVKSGEGSDQVMFPNHEMRCPGNSLQSKFIGYGGHYPIWLEPHVVGIHALTLQFQSQKERQVELSLFSCTCSGVLSYEVLSYLVYEGVLVCEQLEMFSTRQDGDIKPCLRRMHLAVTAIREFLQAMNVYIKMTHLSQEGKEAFVKLQYLSIIKVVQMAVTEDLRCLFVMLLHQFNPNCQSNQYLQDVIVTNHNLLLFLDRVNKLPEFKSTSSLTEHIQQFATVEIMHQYGLLLENIHDNGEFINDCVFTMMHHIGGDVRQVSTLFQPSILKCFTRILESDFELCDDWSDLIEYVIHKFVDTPRQTAILPEVASMGKVQDSLSNNRNTEFSKEDSDNLCWHYCQSVENEDTVGRIIELYAENGVTNKTTSGVTEELVRQGIIDSAQHEKLKKTQTNVHDCMQNISCTDGLSDAELTVPNKIHFFIDHLQKAGKGHLVVWLQKALIEACYAKLCCSRTVVQSNDAAVIEPIPWISKGGIQDRIVNA